MWHTCTPMHVSHMPPFLRCLTIRQWQLAAAMVVYWGQRAITAIETFEAVEKGGLRISAFTMLNAIFDPMFMDGVLTAMSADLENLSSLGKPSPTPPRPVVLLAHRSRRATCSMLLMVLGRRGQE